jgi:hypothetical protein
MKWKNGHKKASDYLSLAGLEIDFARHKTSKSIGKIAGVAWDTRVIPVI